MTKGILPMKVTANVVSIAIGLLLLIYVFTFGGIASNHSVQQYLLLCTGIISINFGLLGVALTENKK